MSDNTKPVGHVIYAFEQALRESIAQDMNKFATNFKNKKDVAEAQKIVRRTN